MIRERKEKALERFQKKIEKSKNIYGRLNEVIENRVKQFEIENSNIIEFENLKKYLVALVRYEIKSKKNSVAMFDAYFLFSDTKFTIKERIILGKINSIFNLNAKSKEKIYNFSRLYLKHVLLKTHHETLLRISNKLEETKNI